MTAMETSSLLLDLYFKSGIRQGALVGDVNRQQHAVTASTLWGGAGWSAASLFGPERTEEIIRNCCMSSLLWKRGSDWFIPAPVFAGLCFAHEDRKAFRKRRWVPLNSLSGLFSGILPADEQEPLFVEEASVSAAIDRGTNAALPFTRRCIKPGRNVTGAILLQGPDEMLGDLQSAFRFLGDTGLGGERSSGWGAFSVNTVPQTENPFAGSLCNKGYRYLTLGALLPGPLEVQQLSTMDQPRGYALWKVRGYVGDTDVIKPTVTCLGHGALLSFRPRGRVIDITPPKTGHPVLFNGMAPSIAIDVFQKKGGARQ